MKAVTVTGALSGPIEAEPGRSPSFTRTISEAAGDWIASGAAGAGPGVKRTIAKAVLARTSS
jgi:hypothetical protein